MMPEYGVDTSYNPGEIHGLQSLPGTVYFFDGYKVTVENCEPGVGWRDDKYRMNIKGESVILTHSEWNRDYAPHCVGRMDPELMTLEDEEPDGEIGPLFQEAE